MCKDIAPEVETCAAKRITIGNATLSYTNSKLSSAAKKACAAFKYLTKQIKDDVYLDELTQADCVEFEQYLRSNGLSTKTIRNYVSTLRAIVRHAGALGFRIPSYEIVVPRADRTRRRIISEEEVEAILHELEHLPDQRDYFELILNTGCRPCEMSVLPWSNVDLAHRQIWIDCVESEDPTLIPLTPRAHEILQRRYATRTNDWVFPGLKPDMHQSDYNTAIRRAIKRSDVNNDDALSQHQGVKLTIRSVAALQRLQRVVLRF
jgi:integrase